MAAHKDGSSRFVAEYVTIGKPPCLTCKYRSKEIFSHCLAFPSGKGIPVDILLGKNDHTEPVEGDHGIQYEAEEA